jgi:CzcA family heavy metal efflux pump
VRQLVDFCLRYKGSVAILAALVLFLGGWIASQIPLDVFPEFVPPSVSVQTESPGFAPLQVEQLVTKPLENALNGATGVATMRSESIPGLSVITITFRDGIDLYHARQGISERLSEIERSLPLGTSPKLSPLVSSTKDLLMIGLASDKVDLFTLRDRADWLLKPLLLAVPGVANVVEFGGDTRQIQIQPDPVKVVSYKITDRDLLKAVQGALALRGLGFVDAAHQRILLQAPIPAPDLSRLGQSVVATRSRTPILLNELATIKEAPALTVNDALVMGKRGVVLWVSGQFGANTLSTTFRIEAALAGILPHLRAEGIQVYPAMQRPANFIERALNSLEQSLGIAAILIFVVLYLFFRDWRSACIIFLAIPLSLTSSLIVLERAGYTLNTMTLAGFAMSLGVLVDDAIIDIENILRRLSQNASQAKPRAKSQVILDGCLEVRAPVVYATLVVIAVFIPELFVSSVQGHLTGPLAITFILAVLSSLFVALTVTPALCALFLSGETRRQETDWLGRLKSFQARFIRLVDRNFRVATAVVIFLLLSSLCALPFVGGSLMPEFREGHFVLYVSSLPGTSLGEMSAVGKRISAKLMQLPFIASVEEQIGRAELSEDTYGTNSAEFHIEMKPDSSVSDAEAEEQLRDLLGHYPGLQTEVTTFLGDRINDSIAGDRAGNVVRLFGDNLEELDSLGSLVREAISDVPGIVDLQFARQSGTPEFSLRFRRLELTAHGLTAQNVLDTLGDSYSDVIAGQTYQDIRAINVGLLLPEALRERPENLGDLMIQGALGPVPLSQVAQVVPIEGRYSIRHEGGQRFVPVTFNVAGRSLEGTVNNAKADIASEVHLPSDVHIAFAGASVAEQQTRTQFLLNSAIAVVFIVTLLLVCFHWRSHAWLVLANLPFALIGSIAAIAVTGIGLTLGALVGLITVFGISARNAILLFSHYEHLVEREGHGWGMETAVLGAQERLIPILLTATITALGLMPLAWQLAKPGQEISGPMAIVVLGGLVSSTMLNLVFLPVVAKHLNRANIGPRPGPIS